MPLPKNHALTNKKRNYYIYIYKRERERERDGFNWLYLSNTSDPHWSLDIMLWMCSTHCLQFITISTALGKKRIQALTNTTLIMGGLCQEEIFPQFPVWLQRKSTWKWCPIIQRASVVHVGDVAAWPKRQVLVGYNGKNGLRTELF